MFLTLIPTIILSPAYLVGLLIGLIACIKMSGECLKSASYLFIGFAIVTAVGTALSMHGTVFSSF